MVDSIQSRVRTYLRAGVPLKRVQELFGRETADSQQDIEKYHREELKKISDMSDSELFGSLRRTVVEEYGVGQGGYSGTMWTRAALQTEIEKRGIEK